MDYKDKIIIGFSGKAENGKTASALACQKILEATGYKCVISPLAKRMKEQARYAGWDGEKDERGRRFLQEISWPVKHYHGEDIFAKWCIEDGINTGADIVLIDDVRMKAEVGYFEKLQEQGVKMYLVRVNRPGHISKLNAEQLKDVSETQLDDYNFKYYIENDGTLDDLSCKCQEFLKEICIRIN